MGNWTLATSKRIKWHGVVAAPPDPRSKCVQLSLITQLVGLEDLARRLHYTSPRKSGSPEAPGMCNCRDMREKSQVYFHCD